MSDKTKAEFIARIDHLRNQVTARYDTLNTEAIWLFIATVGCWSIEYLLIKIIAMLLVCYFLIQKVHGHQKPVDLFSDILEAIKTDIEKSSLEGDCRKARLYEIDDIEKNLLQFKSVYRLLPGYFASCAFWLLSMLSFGYQFLDERNFWDKFF